MDRQARRVASADMPGGPPLPAASIRIVFTDPANGVPRVTTARVSGCSAASPNMALTSSPPME
jgi:hypothetical protein